MYFKNCIHIQEDTISSQMVCLKSLCENLVGGGGTHKGSVSPFLNCLCIFSYILLNTVKEIINSSTHLALLFAK